MHYDKSACIALAAVCALSGIAHATATAVRSSETTSIAAGDTPEKKEKKRWGGSAACSAECTEKNGVKICKPVTVSVGFSYESEDAARTELKAALDAQVQNLNGKIKGSITFSVTVKVTFD